MHIAGQPFAFDGPANADSEMLLDIWKELFASVESVPDARPITVTVISRAQSNSPVTMAPADASLLFENEDACFWVGANGDYWMQRADFDCSMTPDRLTFEIAPKFWEHTLFDKRDAFLTAVSAQLRLRGIYGFHGNGLKKDGDSVLIVGDSGAGKTTLTLSLVRSGWSYLSDDALGLTRANGKIEARALRQGISLTADAKERWKGTGMWAEAPKPLGSSKGKDLVLPNESLWAQHIPSCVPQAIFFCQVGDSDTSQIIELPKAAALGLCLRQALGLWMNSSLTKENMELLKDMVDQAACYRIISGRDVIDNPESVSELIHSASKR